VRERRGETLSQMAIRTKIPKKNPNRIVAS
jgi:hypothetical protein